MSAHILNRKPSFLHRLAESIRIGLCKLNQIQFEAPWNPRQHRC